jgi:hypothetical protein
MNHDKLAAFLERVELDEKFAVERGPRGRRKGLVVDCGGIAGFGCLVIKPDHIIRRISDRVMVALGGSKNSFRERWRTDDRDAIIMKLGRGRNGIHPLCKWIELTGQEYDTWTTEKVLDALQDVERMASFDFLASTASPDSLLRLFDGLTEFLKKL